MYVNSQQCYYNHAFIVPLDIIMRRTIRGVFAGAGSDGLNEVEVCKAIIRLTNKEASQVIVAYLGTATYDLPQPQIRQTEKLVAMGCTIKAVQVADPTLKEGIPAIKSVLESCDVVVVSGGNTLYAMERWKVFGIDTMLTEAASRGCVMSGGSAGAICWFDGGHSDSMDPDTYRNSMMAIVSNGGDEATAAPTADSERKKWKYIRIPGLSLVPGLCCPHYDKTQSNGVPRSDDFKEMMLRHSQESVVCIDHWAALVVDGDNYEVLSISNKTRAVPEGGKPWCYIGKVADGVPIITALSPSGPMASTFEFARDIVDDPLVAQCISENPPVL